MAGEDPMGGQARTRGDIPGDGEPIDISSTDHTCAKVTTAIWVGTGGTLKLTLESGVTVPFPDVPDGTYFLVRAKVVVKTGTDCDGMVALWTYNPSA